MGTTDVFPGPKQKSEWAVRLEIEKNGTSKSEPYRKTDPFSSYGPNKGTKKWPKSQITPNLFWGGTR